MFLTCFYALHALFAWSPIKEMHIGYMHYTLPLSKYPTACINRNRFNAGTGSSRIRVFEQRERVWGCARELCGANV